MSRNCHWLWAVGLALFGCQALAGIEEGRYVADRDDDSNPDGGMLDASPACREYCEGVTANCTGEFLQYSSMDTCLGYCALLDPGDPLEPAGNTLACRANQASAAGGTREPAEHCPNAGPGGGDVCGSDCESYCMVARRACPADVVEFKLVPDRNCEQKCEVFSKGEPFHAETLEGDTLTCRLVHLSAAAVEPEVHCPHVGVLPDGFCVDGASTEPTCDGYCRAVDAACADDDAVYDSLEQCHAVCETLPLGERGDTAGNSVGCRRYHAYAALLEPLPHCAHAGPSGGGICGVEEDAPAVGNCASYCTIVEAACASDFSAAFSESDDCIEQCEALEDAASSVYSVSEAEASGPFACRVLHAVRALEDEDLCDAALGAAPCDE